MTCGTAKPAHLRVAVLTVALGLGLLRPDQGVAAEEGPFLEFSGAWRGEGNVVFSSGAMERIRCQAEYTAENEGNVLRQALRCASASYTIEVQAELVHSDGALSGTWSEAANEATGDFSGKASAGQLQGFVRGSKFAASVAATITGDQQSVTIRPEGERVTEVSVQLRKT